MQLGPEHCGIGRRLLDLNYDPKYSLMTMKHNNFTVYIDSIHIISIFTSYLLYNIIKHTKHWLIVVFLFNSLMGLTVSFSNYKLHILDKVFFVDWQIRFNNRLEKREPCIRWIEKLIYNSSSAFFIIALSDFYNLMLSCTKVQL